MKKILILGLIFSLGLSITYTKSLALASRVAMVTDRVCENLIEKNKAKKYKMNGHKYYFCSKKCKKTFKKNPEKYACICPALYDECPCSHCASTGELCDCAERAVNMESRSGEQKEEKELNLDHEETYQTK